jgi:hypothetical protein
MSVLTIPIPWAVAPDAGASGSVKLGEGGAQLAEVEVKVQKIVPSPQEVAEKLVAAGWNVVSVTVSVEQVTVEVSDEDVTELEADLCALEVTPEEDYTAEKRAVKTAAFEAEVDAACADNTALAALMKKYLPH